MGINKKKLLNFISLLIIITIIYGIWAIQPSTEDDWNLCYQKPHTLFVKPFIPKTGQEIRHCFNGFFLLPTNPFSFFKPWSLLTAVVITSLCWVALINESILMRAGLTLLTALGFPYLGHIGPWNVGASMYTVSVLWMIIWCVVLKKIRYADTKLALKGILFFILTFIAASWHEVWLVTFAGIVTYFIIDAIFLLRKRDQFFKLRPLGMHLSIVLGYILALVFYTRGGPSKFIDARLAIPGLFESLFNWPYIFKAFLSGTKENIILIKDSLPIFLLIIYIKLNKDFKARLNLDFRLFIAAAFGSILFIYVWAFIWGKPDGRVAWLCLLTLSVAFYALPKSILIGNFNFERNNFFIKAARFCSIVVATISLSYNAYFTYIYTNIDVAGWLQYRQMVLNHNPDVMKKLCCRTLPKDRPRGWEESDHVWGAQSNKYRYFVGPEEYAVHWAINDIWHKNTEPFRHKTKFMTWRRRK